MHNKPDVSVLMAAYNTESFIEDAVRSIFNQSLESFELIVIDDGSSDRTHEILSDLSHEDSRLSVYSRPNRGIVATRNELLSYANAELLAWADSDDISEPERLKKQTEYFEVYPDLVSLGCSVLDIDTNGRPISIVTFPGLLDIDKHLHSPVTDSPFCASMMRTQVVRDLGGFREPFPIGEDFDLFLRLIEVGEVRNLKDVLCRYRQHPKSISSTSQLGSDWMAFFELIHGFAMERRRTGKDPIQRGESVEPVEISSRPSNLDSSGAIQYAQWARQAKTHGFLSSAIVFAFSAVFRSPLSAIGWRSLAHVLLRRSHK